MDDDDGDNDENDVGTDSDGDNAKEDAVAKFIHRLVYMETEKASSQ